MFLEKEDSVEIHVLFISNYITITTQPFHNRRNETKRGPLSTGRTGQLCCWPRGPWMWQLRIWFVCHGRWNLHPMHSTMALTVKILRKSLVVFVKFCQIHWKFWFYLMQFCQILVNVLSNDSCFIPFWLAVFETCQPNLSNDFLYQFLLASGTMQWSFSAGGCDNDWFWWRWLDQMAIAFVFSYGVEAVTPTFYVLVLVFVPSQLWL